MPSEPVIQPPTPVIRQTDTPEEIARVQANVQKMFDKVAPHMGDAPKPEPPKVEPPPVSEPAPATPASTEPEQPPPSAPPETTPEPSRIPSFIEKALEVETSQPAAEPKPPVVDELPEELPEFKTPEESKQNWRQFRDKYKALKKEADTLRNRPSGMDEKTTQELEFLKNQNQELNTQLSRLGVERHQEFQQKILAPMQAAWTDAARIVHEAGGNPQDLAKAMGLSGRAHFEAMDEVFSALPETAKLEATEAVRAYKRLDDQRRRALADAPKTAQALHKADLERQYKEISSQQEEMKRLWEDAGRKLRDEAKVEVLQKSADPDAKWWNEQADQLEETSRRLFLENTDMGKVAIAMRLAPMVDVYRKLWLATRQELGKKGRHHQRKVRIRAKFERIGREHPGERDFIGRRPQKTVHRRFPEEIPRITRVRTLKGDWFHMEHEVDSEGRPRALAPEKVDQTKEGARLNKIEQERIQRAQEEKASNPQGVPAEKSENQGKKEK